MSKLEKYQGVIPAFYACYDDEGEISPERIKKLAKHYLEVGVKGLYINGSSGECIYQNVAERKLVLETVMEAVGGKMTIIAHVAANSTRDSIELAQHAEKLGVDAIAAIPPVYFKMPEYAIEAYWTEIMESTELDFIIYNIPGTTGYALSVDLFHRMIQKPQCIGVKNSSMPIQDIYLFRRDYDLKDTIIFNGPDEQFLGGRVMGADGGIGGTYGAMPKLFLAMDQCIRQGKIEMAQEIQYKVNDIIFGFFKCEGNMYSVIKEILRKQGINIGQVRGPLFPFTEEDVPKIEELYQTIEAANQQYEHLIH